MLHAGFGLSIIFFVSFWSSSNTWDMGLMGGKNEGGTCRRHDRLIEICLRISTATENIIRPRYCIRSNFSSPPSPLRSWSSPKLDLSPTLLGSCYQVQDFGSWEKHRGGIVVCTPPSFGRCPRLKSERVVRISRLVRGASGASGACGASGPTEWGPGEGGPR
ncbi:hypothetical protein BO82DRAFT_89499 [Aspergillus uvarum CBS 121591]|uniref:Secreted protein n=1 Tax=Aspergillus uvarum CBS 121591 TaxID=1448315 RepID=A0A319CQ71_9EURO|nr:hypothetical protein BO82DRAFT_89499 [Aspergillus uvarum CBS 121591]PYH86569.1 hypothetical protein BO82DRAFT_89499 [Aspergillus uvarum CBS 121591]